MTYSGPLPLLTYLYVIIVCYECLCLNIPYISLGLKEFKLMRGEDEMGVV